jgi:hypothetical protein
MDHEVGPWKMAFLVVQLHDLTSMVWFQFTKPLGPSLGVDRMWPRGMAMHQNVNVMIFINVCPRRVVLKKKFKFHHSQISTIYKLVIVSHKLLKISVLWILSLLLHLQKALCHMTYVHALFYFFLYGYGWLELRNTRTKLVESYMITNHHTLCVII